MTVGKIHIWFKSPWKGWSGLRCERCGTYVFTFGPLRAIWAALTHRCKIEYYVTDELLRDDPRAHQERITRMLP